MALTSLLRLLFWIGVLFLALSFFGISIQSIVNSPIGQANLTYLTNLLAPVVQFISQLWLWATEWIRPYAANIAPAPSFLP